MEFVSIENAKLLSLSLPSLIPHAHKSDCFARSSSSSPFACSFDCLCMNKHQKLIDDEEEDAHVRTRRARTHTV